MSALHGQVSSDGQKSSGTQNSAAIAHLFNGAGQLIVESQKDDACATHQGFDDHRSRDLLQEGVAESTHQVKSVLLYFGDQENGDGFHTHQDDDGHANSGAHSTFAEVVPCNGGGGHGAGDAQDINASSSPRAPGRIAHIRHLYKQRKDIIRAHGNLTRQVISICRHAVGFNTFLPKEERAAAEKRADALMKALKAGQPEAAVVMDSAGYLLHVIEQAGFEKQKALIERNMAKAVKGLGADEFVAATSGFSTTQLACILGEAGDLANYATVSRLWKRMGMGVINGKRQSKQASVADAMDHGYNPARRSAMWNIGETLIKAQIRNPKGEDGKPIGEPVAIGYYGQVYLDRKKDLAERHPDMTKAHAHNDAKRIMEKRLLRELWKEWRKNKHGQ